MLDPRRLVALPAEESQRQRPLVALVALVADELERALGLVEEQRALQPDVEQLPDWPRQHLGRGGEGHVEIQRGRHGRAAQQAVVGEEARRRRGQPRGPDVPPGGLRQRDVAAEQRMPAASPRFPDIADGGRCPSIEVVEPVPGPLPWIARECDAASRRIDAGPIDAAAAGVQAGERRRDRRPWVHSSPHRRDGGECGPGRLADLRGRAAHHFVRVELQERAVPVGNERPERGVNVERLAQVPRPVTRSEFLASDLAAGDGRDHRDPRPARGEGCQRRHQLGRQRVHQGSVERDLDARHHAAGDAAAVERGQQPGQRFSGTGDDGRAGPGAPGDGDRAAPGAGSRGLVERQAHYGRPSLSLDPIHEPAAVVHDRDGLLERECTADVRRGSFAEALADHRVGFDAVGGPQGGEAGLHREDGGLRDIGPGDWLAGTEPAQKPSSAEGSVERLAFLDDIAEGRLALQQRRGHLRPLRPLPAEHEDDAVVVAAERVGAAARAARSARSSLSVAPTATSLRS